MKSGGAGRRGSDSTGDEASEQSEVESVGHGYGDCSI